MAGEQGKHRLVQLLKTLYAETDEEHGLSMPQIIERIEAAGIRAERKAIYRDFDVLRELGFDVRKRRSRPVEYAIANRPFTQPELLLLVDAVQGSRFLTQAKSDELVDSIKGLASAHQAASLSKRVHVEGRVSSQSESTFANVDVIHRAMAEKRKVDFLYFKYDLEKGRKMQRGGKRYLETPLHLVYADGFYYLITYNDKYADFTTYRVDRMFDIVASDEPATSNDAILDFDVEEFRKCAFGMFKGSLTALTLLVEESAMSGVVDRFGEDARIGVPEGDRARVHVSAMESPTLFGWLAQFGTAVKIETPESLAASYAAYLKEIAGMYPAG